MNKKRTHPVQNLQETVLTLFDILNTPPPSGLATGRYVDQGRSFFNPFPSPAHSRELPLKIRLTECLRIASEIKSSPCSPRSLH